MKKSLRFIVFLFLFVWADAAFGQQRELDSLNNLLHQTKADTEIVRLRFYIGQYASVYRIPYWDSLLRDCREYKRTADEKSRHFLSLYEADILNNFGFIYYTQGNIENALEYLVQSLNIQEKIGHLQGASTTLSNIGHIYFKLGEDQKALENFLRCLKLREDIGEVSKIGHALTSIALVYRNRGDTLKALEYFNRSLSMHEKANPPDKVAHANALLNLGALYLNKGDINSAMKFYDKCMKMQLAIGDKEGLSYAYNDLGSYYFTKKDYSKALGYCIKAYKLGVEAGYPDLIRNSSQKLSAIYESKGDFKTALSYYELYIKMNDSLINENTRKAIIKTQLDYEYAKKAATDSIERVKKKQIAAAKFAKQNAELRAKKNQQYGLFGGLGAVFLFAGFMYHRVRITKKQKTLIELQKLVVEEKQKEVLDSIYYARRIQRALITSEKYINRQLKRLKTK